MLEVINLLHMLACKLTLSHDRISIDETQTFPIIRCGMFYVYYFKNNP